MNNFYSPPERYFTRWITPSLRQACQDHPVVVLTGARQVGKSTLLLNEEPFRTWRFHSLDDFDVLSQALEQPEALWAGVDRVVIDEVQRAPHVLSAVKQAVDSQPGRFRFLLSGSANLLLMRQVSESLAGRAVYFILHPMTLGEIHQVPSPDILSRLLDREWLSEGEIPESPPNYIHILLRGLMPALFNLQSSQAWVRWWEGYVTTYLERDLRQTAQIDALLDFRRVMGLAALRTGQLMNQSELARDAHVSQATVHRYLNTLETTHLFERLQVYTSSHTKRLVKSPKAYWSDPGLAVFLSGYFTEPELGKAREVGAFFETLIYRHLRVLASLMTPAARIFFWRTQAGKEVDFIVEHGQRVLAIEVKNTNRPGYGDTVNMQAFLSEHPKASGGLLVHSGRQIRRLGEKILALPWSLFTG